MIAVPQVQAGGLVALLPDHVDPQPTPIVAVILPDRQRLPKVRVCVDHLAARFGG